MSRLPNPGADTGVWGDILNDFLLTEHQPNGTLKLRTDGTIEPAIASGTTAQYWRAGYTRKDGTKVKGHFVNKPQ